MKIKLINHACFMIEFEGKIIYFDPYEIPKDSAQADIILVSHDHHDHFDEKSVKIISKDSTILIGPRSCKKIVSKKNAYGLDPGDVKEIEKISIIAVPAYNPNKRFHPKSNNWLGFIVSNGEIKIYHAGDTDLIPEMKDLSNIDYAMLPVGDTYTMGFEESAKAVNVINPKNFIPMHTWDKDLKSLKKMINDKNPEVNIIILSKGEVFSP